MHTAKALYDSDIIEMKYICVFIGKSLKEEFLPIQVAFHK